MLTYCGSGASQTQWDSRLTAHSIGAPASVITLFRDVTEETSILEMRAMFCKWSQYSLSVLRSCAYIYYSTMYIIVQLMGIFYFLFFCKRIFWFSFQNTVLIFIQIKFSHFSFLLATECSRIGNSQAIKIWKLEEKIKVTYFSFQNVLHSGKNTNGNKKKKKKALNTSIRQSPALSSVGEKEQWDGTDENGRKIYIKTHFEFIFKNIPLSIKTKKVFVKLSDFCKTTKIILPYFPPSYFWSSFLSIYHSGTYSTSAQNPILLHQFHNTSKRG